MHQAAMYSAAFLSHWAHFTDNDTSLGITHADKQVRSLEQELSAAALDTDIFLLILTLLKHDLIEGASTLQDCTNLILGEDTYVMH